MDRQRCTSSLAKRVQKRSRTLCASVRGCMCVCEGARVCARVHVCVRGCMCVCEGARVCERVHVWGVHVCGGIRRYMVVSILR